MAKEMEIFKVVFNTLQEVDKVYIGHQLNKYHMMFDINIESFKIKTCLLQKVT